MEAQYKFTFKANFTTRTCGSPRASFLAVKEREVPGTMPDTMASPSPATSSAYISFSSPAGRAQSASRHV